MVTGDAAAEAVALGARAPARGRAPLVLVQGRPATPGLARRGRRRLSPRAGSDGHPLRLAYLSRAGRAELRREIDAQLAAFAATGLSWRTSTAT
jgi:hypothetical protein